MLWGILNSILSSLGTISWKRSLDTSMVSTDFFKFLGMPAALIVGGVYVILGKVNFSLPLATYAIILLLSFLAILSAGMSQNIYKEEKISALLPFQNLSSVFTIVLAYFLFPNASAISFGIAVFTILLIFGFSFDFRAFTLPRNMLLVFSWSILGAVRSLLVAYIIVSVTSAGYFVFSSAIITLLLIVPLVKNKGWNEMKKGTKEFYFHRIGGSVLGQGSVLLNFFLLEKLGLIMSTLLGFLTLGTTILFGYFILHDLPKVKNIILALLVSGLVFLGVYFK